MGRECERVFFQAPFSHIVFSIYNFCHPSILILLPLHLYLPFYASLPHFHFLFQLPTSPASLPEEVVARKLLRSPSPHAFLSTLSDPLHQRSPPTICRSQSAEHHKQHRSPCSSTSQSRITHRKLPAIPPGASNTKIPSVIRITRAQLQQVNALFPSASAPSTHSRPLFLQFVASASLFVLLMHAQS